MKLAICRGDSLSLIVAMWSLLSKCGSLGEVAYRGNLEDISAALYLTLRTIAGHNWIR